MSALRFWNPQLLRWFHGCWIVFTITSWQPLQDRKWPRLYSIRRWRLSKTKWTSKYHYREELKWSLRPTCRANDRRWMWRNYTSTFLFCSYLIRNNHPVWDRFIFSKIQKKLGGRIRLFVVGSAPLAANVLNVVRCALGCIIVEGYGQTECTAPCTLTLPGDTRAGHVGPPIGCCEVKVCTCRNVSLTCAKIYSSRGERAMKHKNRTIHSVTHDTSAIRNMYSFS